MILPKNLQLSRKAKWVSMQSSSWTAVLFEDCRNRARKYGLKQARAAQVEWEAGMRKAALTALMYWAHSSNANKSLAPTATQFKPIFILVFWETAEKNMNWYYLSLWNLIPLTPVDHSSYHRLCKAAFRELFSPAVTTGFPKKVLQGPNRSQTQRRCQCWSPKVQLRSQAKHGKNE